MDDRAPTHPDRRLSLQLDLCVDREPISGSLCCDRGPTEQFVGWLGFVEALRRLADAQSHERS
jgi:hypothetical protein